MKFFLNRCSLRETGGERKVWSLLIIIEVAIQGCGGIDQSDRRSNSKTTEDWDKEKFKKRKENATERAITRRTSKVRTATLTKHFSLQ